MSAEAIHLLNLPKKHVLSQTHLENIEISSPADKEILTYEAATQKWKNKALDIPYLQAIGTTNISTNSVTYVDIAGLSLTIVEAGYYLIMCSMNIYMAKPGSAFREGYVQVIQNTSRLFGGRVIRAFTDTDFSLSCAMSGIYYLFPADIIKAQWRVSVNDTTIYNSPTSNIDWRILKAIKIKVTA